MASWPGRWSIYLEHRGQPRHRNPRRCGKARRLTGGIVVARPRRLPRAPALPTVTLQVPVTMETRLLPWISPKRWKKRSACKLHQATWYESQHFTPRYVFCLVTFKVLSRAQKIVKSLSTTSSPKILQIQKNDNKLKANKKRTKTKLPATCFFIFFYIFLVFFWSQSSTQPPPLAFHLLRFFFTYGHLCLESTQVQNHESSRPR